MWRHQRKGTLLRKKQCLPRSAVSTPLRCYFLSKLRRKRDKCFLKMLIRDKYHRPWSDAAHDARPLIRAYDICSAIRSFFVEDVTIIILDNSFIRNNNELPLMLVVKRIIASGKGSLSKNVTKCRLKVMQKNLPGIIRITFTFNLQ